MHLDGGRHPCRGRPWALTHSCPSRRRGRERRRRLPGGRSLLTGQSRWFARIFTGPVRLARMVDVSPSAITVSARMSGRTATKIG